ncbi:RING/FYVE/PHD-type zinc finger family protein isoform 1 [Hibiscus syriacus]|uniref:RING/FYVE/PHD-type zinc finger family protein isoform 1 n=1 Tax=Hibiscus syriacus TaxID=106335 RepID=A0A6A2ZET2_HIBSY|nr:RING/FYVE/PHD-type zinc finger family protein isoform 1 [Hibiscus syriacus]
MKKAANLLNVSMETTSSSKLSIFFPVIFLLLLSTAAAATDNSFIGKDPLIPSWRRTSLVLQRNNNKNQIPSCSEMSSRSQCLQNPVCRWCRSEALDDMCFKKAEARRLPQQVFLCN